MALWLRWIHDGRTLQWAIAHLPTGVSAAEADRALGPPDTVCQAKGVLVNGVMFLADANPQATKYGQVRTYEQRIWNWGTGTASVFVDANGRIAGRVFTD